MIDEEITECVFCGYAQETLNVFDTCTRIPPPEDVDREMFPVFHLCNLCYGSHAGNIAAYNRHGQYGQEVVYPVKVMVQMTHLILDAIADLKESTEGIARKSV